MIKAAHDELSMIIYQAEYIRRCIGGWPREILIPFNSHIDRVLIPAPLQEIKSLAECSAEREHGPPENIEIIIGRLFGAAPGCWGFVPAVGKPILREFYPFVGPV